MNKYDVSALIVTYQPDYIKTVMTINSFLLQKNVRLQIVIADDGSDVDHFSKLEAFFLRHHFLDFVFVKNANNVGTVKNIASGLEKCSGEYIKTLSPGDYIYNENTLHNWVDYMRRTESAMSGSEYTCYTMEEGQEQPCVKKAHPQLNNLQGSKLIENYLINNDIFLGSAILCKTTVFRTYLRMILGKVKYAEDNCFRIMAFCEEKINFFNEETVLYETGTGISTSGEDKWSKLLEEDWCTTDNILRNLPTDNMTLRRSFDKIAYIRASQTTSIIRKLACYCSIRGLLISKAKIALNPRFTSHKLPSEWLEKLKENSEGSPSDEPIRTGRETCTD